MSKADIREFRRWHRDAALRARRAGFDVIYVYAAHSLALPMHFLQRRHNHRSDEYGGSLANRARLLRELIEDTKDAVGAHCAVAVRFAVDELLGPDGITADGEGREVVALLAELPDLWDVNVSDWAHDSRTSRFAAEGYQEDFVRFVKTVTHKPVVGVGRFHIARCDGVRKSGAAFWTSSAPRDRRLPIHSCRARSRMATSTTFANASAATCA